MESQRTSNWITTKLQRNCKNNNDKITRNKVNFPQDYSCIRFKYYTKNGKTLEKTKTSQKIRKTPEKHLKNTRKKPKLLKKIKNSPKTRHINCLSQKVKLPNIWKLRLSMRSSLGPINYVRIFQQKHHKFKYLQQQQQQ